MRAVVLALVPVLLAGCLAPSPSAEDRAVDWLADHLEDGVPLAQVAEAVAPFVDLADWPADRPLLDRLVTGQGLGSDIRLLHALAHASGASALQDAAAEAVRAGWDGQRYGATGSNDDALALIALTRAGVDHPAGLRDGLRDALLDAQKPDGGWSDWSDAGQVDETVWAVVALAAAGSLDAVRVPVVPFLDAARTDGAYGYGGVANCQTTGLARAAHAALDLAVPAAMTDFLRSCQNADGGYAYTPGAASDAWATTDVLWGAAEANAL